MKKNKEITIGIDLGDRKHEVCVFDGQEVLVQKSISNTRESFFELNKKYPGSRIVIEAGTHSPWISHQLKKHGHDVVVANPRNVKLISNSDRKCDKKDAKLLARLGHADVELLSPITHRGPEHQKMLSQLKSRECLVSTRASLINHVRGSVKSLGERIASSSAPCFTKKACRCLSSELLELFCPVFHSIDKLTEEIKKLDKSLENLAKASQACQLMMQIAGVGTITALSFFARIEDPSRFNENREVGAYLGLTPKRDQSGKVDKQLGISKRGDRYLRKLLVSCAQYIMGRFGPDTDLRRFGFKLMGKSNSKAAKKKAVVAVARKLSVLMLRLWKDDSTYDPISNKKLEEDLLSLKTYAPLS